jgi:hypothetical protein
VLAVVISVFGVFSESRAVMAWEFFVSGVLFASAVFLLVQPVRLRDLTAEQRRHAT